MKTMLTTKVKVTTGVAVGVLAMGILSVAAAVSFINRNQITKVCMNGPVRGRTCMSNFQCLGGTCGPARATAPTAPSRPTLGPGGTQGGSGIPPRDRP